MLRRSSKSQQVEYREELNNDDAEKFLNYQQFRDVVRGETISKYESYEEADLSENSNDILYRLWKALVNKRNKDGCDQNKVMSTFENDSLRNFINRPKTPYEKEKKKAFVRYNIMWIEKNI
ncbi:hypothetical protein HHI36_008034 [Cryptolaemus montrouzieri]|uniref:Uncharacterized protein n=1 Tax=Cryptolaemus montrouzieri TaxID=559131 RepID=A0ABD2MRH4_9CUCU